MSLEKVTQNKQNQGLVLDNVKARTFLLHRCQTNNRFQEITDAKQKLYVSK